MIFWQYEGRPLDPRILKPDFTSAMTAASIDTHKIFVSLTASGMPNEQATAITSALRDAREFDLSTIATRSDVREAELRLEGKIEAVRSDILKWMVSAIGFQTVVVIGAIAGLFKLLH